MSYSDEIVKVLVRFRPLLESELSCSPLSCVDISENKVTIFPPNTNSLTFTYDKVLGSLDSQEEVYNSGLKNLVLSVMQGFNGTVLTYGQAFSGKTYTMFGDPEDNEKKGIIPRMISTIFEHIDAAEENIEFLIKISFFELYNEKIFDLLNPLGSNLKIKNQKKGVSIEGLREVYTPSDFDIHELIKVGILNKQSREASGITKSGFSHSFFCLDVEQTSPDSGFKVGKLSLVDLASAEKQTVCDKPDQIKSINSSLSNLANVINALADKSSAYVPYRGSKLTRILEDSLGGNSKTTIIVTCSASPLSLEETLSSLRFALRIKSVKNFPIINRESSIQELKIQFINKLEALREANRKLEFLESQEPPHDKHVRRPSLIEESPKEPVDYTEIREELAEIHRRIEQQESVRGKLEQEILTCQHTLKEMQKTGQDQQELLEKLESTSAVLETDIKDVENSLEAVITSVDGMNTEYEAESDLIQGLEKKVSELFADIEHLKCKVKCMTEMRSSISKAAVEEQLRRRIREEKEKNKHIKDESKKIQFEIDVLLFKRYKDYMEADNLQVAGKKIMDLELEIDKARMKYLEDEQRLNFEQKHAKMHRDALNKTVDSISRDYRNLTAKHAEVLLEKMIFQKKSARLEEKAQKLMADIVKIDKRLTRIEKFHGNNGQVAETGKVMQRSLFMIKRSMMSFTNPV